MGTHTSTTAGPHNSNMTNKVDPHVVHQALASTVPTVPTNDTDLVRILRKVCPGMLAITEECYIHMPPPIPKPASLSPAT